LADLGNGIARACVTAINRSWESRGRQCRNGVGKIPILRYVEV
jgi:hypothetical protein